MVKSYVLVENNAKVGSPIFTIEKREGEKKISGLLLLRNSNRLQSNKNR